MKVGDVRGVYGTLRRNKILLGSTGDFKYLFGNTKILTASKTCQVHHSRMSVNTPVQCPMLYYFDIFTLVFQTIISTSRIQCFEVKGCLYFKSALKGSFNYASSELVLYGVLIDSAVVPLQQLTDFDRKELKKWRTMAKRRSNSISPTI